MISAIKATSSTIYSSDFLPIITVKGVNNNGFLERGSFELYKNARSITFFQQIAQKNNIRNLHLQTAGTQMRE
jgi:hypothetical protein